MTTQTRTKCLIQLGDCGRIAGEPVCSKCGLDDRVRYVSEEAGLLAKSQAEAKYWKSEAEATTQQVDIEHSEIERAKATEGKREAAKLRNEMKQRGKKREPKRIAAKQVQQPRDVEKTLFVLVPETRWGMGIGTLLMGIGILWAIIYSLFFHYKRDWFIYFFSAGMVFMVFFLLIVARFMLFPDKTPVRLISKDDQLFLNRNEEIVLHFGLQEIRQMWIEIERDNNMMSGICLKFAKYNGEQVDFIDFTSQFNMTDVGVAEEVKEAILKEFPSIRYVGVVNK